MPLRKIVRIDEEKCNGCGECVPSCEEGAIQVIDGKARLVREIYCDGLGACLNDCPEGAIQIEEREAEAFDAQETERHLQRQKLAKQEQRPQSGGCPGSMARTLAPMGGFPIQSAAPQTPSALGNWPLQLKLVPPSAPYFQDADLLLVADCVPFAVPDFHARYLTGKPVTIACPKLDGDLAFYAQKFAGILTSNTIKSITVLRMEVPCCAGLTHFAVEALESSGAEIPLEEIVIGIRGQENGRRNPCECQTA